jgi:hypothetical protein
LEIEKREKQTKFCIKGVAFSKNTTIAILGFLTFSLFLKTNLAFRKLKKERNSVKKGYKPLNLIN